MIFPVDYLEQNSPPINIATCCTVRYYTTCQEFGYKPINYIIPPFCAIANSIIAEYANARPPKVKCSSMIFSNISNSSTII